MLKKILVLVLAVCMVFGVFTFVSCSSQDSVKNITVEGEIYSIGEQEITIVSAEPFDAEYSGAQFKESIAKKDIKLSGKLSGKTIESVTYVSSTEIRVKLSGKISGITGSATAEDDVTNVITILSSGVENGYESFTIVTIYNPSFKCSQMSKNNVGGIVNYVGYYELTCGDLNNTADLSSATIVSGNGTLNCSFYQDTDKTLVRIEVTNSTQQPTVKLPAGLTGYNQEITVGLVIGSAFYFTVS